MPTILGMSLLWWLLVVLLTGAVWTIGCAVGATLVAAAKHAVGKA